jgi:hypothetical protein
MLENTVQDMCDYIIEKAHVQREDVLYQAPVSVKKATYLFEATSNSISVRSVQNAQILFSKELDFTLRSSDLIDVFSSPNNPVGYTSGAILTAHDNTLHSFKLNLENITVYDFKIVNQTQLDFTATRIKSIKNRGLHKILAYNQ